MKITKKIGNEYYTVEGDEIDKVAPTSVKEAIFMIFWGLVMAAAFWGGIMLLGYFLETFC